MGVDVLVLVVIGGMTVLAYMIAINAHGPTRLGISYLLATLMLAGTVWVVVQHVNADLDLQRREELRQLGQEKALVEEKLREQEAGQGEAKERAEVGARLAGVVSAGSALASEIAGADLQDRSVDFDGLVARAVAAIRRADGIKEDYDRIASAERLFPEGAKTVDEALKTLKDAVHYYRSFYSSEDDDQEALRERIMRQKARAASTLFGTASAQIVSGR